MSFIDFARAHGILIHSMPPIGRWVRFPTDDKPKKRNGSVKYMGDFGLVQNHAVMTEVAIWKGEAADAAAIAKRDAELARLRRDVRQKEQKAVAAAAAYFTGLQPLRNGHPYLENKGLSMMGCGQLRVDGELLVIPMHRAGQFASLQTITPTGEKKYRYGCPVRGASFAIMRPKSILTVLAEGFATGLAIFQSIPDSSVIVCFDAGNLAHVARGLRLKGMAVVAADNDYETERKTGINTGIAKGKEAAGILRCGVAAPEGIEGTDWADALMEWQAPFRVKNEIMRRARPVM